MSSSSSYFKCNSCAIQFPNSDSQRYHMKTDWHRYNLKRRVAGLTPVDAAVFSEKVQQSKQFEEDRDEFGFRVLKNKERTKKFHINQSNKINHRGRPLDVHEIPNSPDVDAKERELSPASTVATEVSHISLGESVYSVPDTHTDVDSNFETSSETGISDLNDFNSDDDDEYFDEGSQDDDEDDSFAHDSQYEEEPLQPITSCIYCGIPHSDVETNVTHMFRNHGLYIPERSYLVDLKGLLEYLISIIVLDNECLCCNFKGRNLESIRAHVTSKGHCRLPYESKEERAEFARFYDFSSINTIVDQSKSRKTVGFSTDTTNEVEDSDESLDDEQDDNGINDNYTVATIDPLISELTLPNGARLGHRSLQRIYRQNVHIPITPSDGQLTVSTADRRLANGLTVSQVDKQQKESQAAESRQKSRNVTRDVKRFNFQPHYRDPMLGG